MLKNAQSFRFISIIILVRPEKGDDQLEGQVDEWAMAHLKGL